MTTDTAVLLPQATVTVSVPQDTVAPRPAFPARILLSVGLVGMLVAGAALAWPDREDRPGPQATPQPSVAAAAVTPGAVSVASVTYEPGQSSGWHNHPGLHAVAVTAGVLTVYGPDCAPRTYGPGESYVGGHELHVTRNETTTPVEMVVTSIDTTRLANSVTPHQPPAGCAVL